MTATCCSELGKWMCDLSTPPTTESSFIVKCAYVTNFHVVTVCERYSVTSVATMNITMKKARSDNFQL